MLICPLIAVTPEGVFLMMPGMAASVMWLHQSNRNNGKKKNVLKDTQAFTTLTSACVQYKYCRSLAKEHIWTRIETGGNKKNGSLVYIRFAIGSNGNNQSKWNACLPDCSELTMHLFKSIWLGLYKNHTDPTRQCFVFLKGQSCRSE